ncbi:TetR/AcrR family transcriptional regulator [Thalassomonas haliotis]|uniref:TetR/AcrR family transcriptional regulator n=1 Tax=Thalassomonas haliotis TaxID=485448 RepID=A0ABY7VFN1_9GAMM|nr:TetR/AcrR family transcriptional regulator [Thalassomonas haliotis]WDE11442.1 TetR/AcrR family transcriptional regulator [Thalassomonas haliotis]
MQKNRSKNEAKRKQILDAATELFTDKGYATTSMDLIARQADVSKQTVYSHFGSKDDLFAAAIEQKCDSYRMLDFSLEDFSDVNVTLLAVAQRFFSMLIAKETLAVHKICAYESKSYPQLSELFYHAGPERLTTEVAKLMALLDEKKALSISNPHHAAVQFLTMLKGEAWLRIEFNTSKQLTREEIDDYICSSVAMFIRAYAPQ